MSTALVALALIAALGGCVTRTSRESFVDQYDLEIDFVSRVKGISTVQPQGHDHPVVVSAERLMHVLGAVEVETQVDGGGVVREPAFHPEILAETATELSRAFSEVGPDQEIAVKVVRKERRVGIFHRKYLTSFLASMHDGYLHLDLSRVDDPIPKNEEDERLPEPDHGGPKTGFRVVSGEPLYYAGPGSLEIAWRDPVFREPYRLPGSTEGRAVRREILEQSPVPRSELEAESPRRGELGDLTPDQLRALADLEEARRAGEITESDYQRARRDLLRDR